MLDLLETEVEASDVVEERFWRLIEHIVLDLSEQTAALVGFFLVTILVLLLQEEVDVHALVDIQEEGYPLRLGEVLDIEHLQLTTCIYILFVFLGHQSFFDVQDLLGFIFCLLVFIFNDSLLVHFRYQAN